MYFRVGEKRPFLLGNTVCYGEILEADEENEIYLIEEIETKEQYIIDEDDVFIGDD